MNFSSLARRIYFNRIFKTCCFEKWIQFLTHSASYSSVFLADTFRSAIPSWFATAVWSDFLFVQFPGFRRHNVVCSRSRSTYYLLVFYEHPSPPDMLANSNWITRASRAFKHSGCLVNYALSLSNADPNKAPARRKMGRKTDWLTNCALSASRLFPIYYH